MRRTASWMRRRVLMLAIAAVGVAAISGTALAGHQTSAVKSYTGCLVSGDGVIVKVKEGNAPKSACTGGQTQVHLSGGDITKISVTGALTGGGDNGEVTIGLKPEFTLPSGCSNGEVAKWNGSMWACAADNDTTYAAGTGLILTPAGSQDTDDAFSIHPDYRVKNTPDCPSGQFATGFEDNGTIKCVAPSSGASAGFFSFTGAPIQLAGTMTILSKNLPAGSYLLFAHVDAFTPKFDGDGRNSGHCDLPNDTAFISIPDDPDDRGTANENMTLVGAVIHSGGTVALTCTETGGNLDINRASFAAIKLDSIG